jgi:uncharacterized Ntn-hydrolase superfamily protein
MLRFLIIAIPSFLVGCVFGAAGWYLASPLFIDRVVSEELASGSNVEALYAGEFRGADSAHQAGGTALVVKRADGRAELQLKDFRVTNGPDLVIYLSKNSDPMNARDITESEFVNLGALRGNVGDQSYTLPSDLDLATYKSAVIWCEQFSVLFAAARLGVQGNAAN